MPYTHSLIGVLVWSTLALIAYKFYSDIKEYSAAIIIAAVIFSHWVLDLLVHRPDLAIWDDSYKVGFGLWNYPILALIIEIGLLIGSMALYLSSLKVVSKKGFYILIVVGLLLTIIQIINQYGPSPTNDKSFAVLALLSYLILAIGIGWVEKKYLLQN